MRITCPQCDKTMTWEENPWRPFCSERCKLLDLGKWASEEYRVPVSESEERQEQEKEKENER